MSVPTDLDRRFRDAAARSGMLDAGYDLVESPVGELLVAATDRGLLRISFDPDPAHELERIAAARGPARAAIVARRSTASIASSTSTSRAAATPSISPSTCAG